MIYLDSSVALAWIFSEDRQPPSDLWTEPLISSRLLEYEVWSRANARNPDEQDREAVKDILDRIELVELSFLALARALEPFPVPVRTLDALHLATAHFLRAQGERLELATYDRRLAEAARALRIPIRAL